MQVEGTEVPVCPRSFRAVLILGGELSPVVGLSVLLMAGLLLVTDHSSVPIPDCLRSYLVSLNFHSDNENTELC